jgi:hypothetical protein
MRGKRVQYMKGAVLGRKKKEKYNNDESTFYTYDQCKSR